MFELIRANKTKSWILIVVLTAVLVALGYVVGSVWTGSGAVGVVIAVIIAYKKCYIYSRQINNNYSEINLRYNQ